MQCHKSIFGCFIEYCTGDIFYFLGKTVFAPLFGQAEASLGMDWAMMFTALSALLGAFAALLIPEKEIKQ